MSDGQLVRQQESAPAPARPRWLLIVAVLVLVALIGAAGAWWYFSSRAQIPDWERAAQLDLAAPAGDAFDNDTRWVRLEVSPLRAGVASTFRASIDTSRGTPSPGVATGAVVESLSIQQLGGTAAPEPLALQRDAGGSVLATASLDYDGWWRLLIEVAGASRPAQLYFLVPDPNINGPNSVPSSQSSADGESLFQRGLAATTALQTVRYSQWIGDGRGNASISRQEAAAPHDGQPGGFSYRAVGGMEAIVIGSTRWVLLPGDLGWQQQEGAVSVPPSEWGEEYTGATGFTVLGDESVDGRPARIVAFVVPEQTEPRRQTAAWYLWWVDTETGHVLKEAMVSRVHYMLYRFADFDVPLELVPPVQAATPAASATPVA